MNHFWKVSQPCLTTRGFTALRCPFGDTLSLVRHGLASFGLQTFLRTKTVNKKVSTFKGALTVGCWLLVARGDCGSAHSRVATFEKIDKRTIGNRLTPQIGKRTIDNGRAPRGSSSCQSVRCVVPSCIFLSVFSPSWQCFLNRGSIENAIPCQGPFKS